jgi:hypothetical protein
MLHSSTPFIQRLKRRIPLLIAAASLLLYAIFLGSNYSWLNDQRWIPITSGPPIGQSSFSAQLPDYSTPLRKIDHNQIRKYTSLPASSLKIDFPLLKDFMASLSLYAAQDIGGVYVPGVLALPIIRQPPGDALYVSNKLGLVTRFQSADQYGVTGLLAHNYLSGEQFYGLQVGQQVWVVTKNHTLQRYRISQVASFQKLDPNNPFSGYKELSTGKIWTTDEVFKRFYRGEPHLTFQTCLEKDGLLNWGLYFVVAAPLRG